MLPILWGTRIPLYPKFQVAVTGIAPETLNERLFADGPNLTPLTKVVEYDWLKLMKFASLYNLKPERKLTLPFATEKSGVPN